MATNGTVTGPNVPSGPDFIIAIRPVLRSLIVAHTFLTLLVPLFFALLHYSTPHTRHQYIFILNVITLTVALSLGTIVDVVGISTILMPSAPLSPTVYIAIGAISIFQSMLVDLVLLMRLVAVYPLKQIGPRRFATITFLPIFLKIVRLINICVFLEISTVILDDSTSGTTNYNAYFTSPSLKLEWGAQIVDNAYATVMFLRSIRDRGPASGRSSDSFITVRTTLSYRLRILFRIALSNFVIPTLFSIVLLVVSFWDVNDDYVGDIMYVNSMLSVFGVVFATVWVGVEGRRNAKEQKQSLNLEFSNMNRSMSSAPGASASLSFLDDGTVGADHHDLEGAKREHGISGYFNVDLEAKHKAKQDN